MEVILFIAGISFGITVAVFCFWRHVLGDIVLIDDSLIVELSDEKALEKIRKTGKYVIFGVRK